VSADRAESGLAAGFHAGPAGALFALRHTPAQATPIRAQALILPPFGEEMNRSRPFLAALARALADAGVAALLPDLHGTGDSAGAFDAADWETWLAEVAFLRAALTARDDGPLHLIGVRTGCLLAAESLARDPSGVAGLVCLQGVANGERFLAQLLRLRVAAAMSRGRKENAKGLRADLESGTPVTLGGYTLAPALARALAARRLESLVPPPGLPVHWIEAVAPATEELPSSAPPATWPRAAMVIRQVRGAPAWSRPEPEVPPALVAAVRDAVCQKPA